MDKKTNIIEEWMPVMYINKDDKYKPISIDKYLEGTTLIDISRNKEVIKSPTQQDLYDLKIMHTQCSFRVDDYKVLYGDLDTAKIYVNKVPIGTETYINYIMYYGFNGFYKWRSPLVDYNNWRRQGGHTADLEHCTIHLDQNNNLKRMLFARHGREEYQWVDATEVEFEVGHPVVYIAKNGHGCYHKPGIWKRPILSLMKDNIPEKTSKDIRWFPQDNYIILKNVYDNEFDPKIHGIMSYYGDLGYKPKTEKNFLGIDIGIRQSKLYTNKPNSCPFKIPFNQKSAVTSFVGNEWFNQPYKQISGNKIPYLS